MGKDYFTHAYFGNIMTFQQNQRQYWAEAIRYVKLHGKTPSGFDLNHQREWAIRCLAMCGPVGTLP